MKYKLKKLCQALALLVLIISINSSVSAAISAEDKENISSQLDSLENSINSGDIDEILNLISPDAKVDLANEIDTQLRGKKVNYEMEIISFEELENNKVKVRSRFAASGIGWSTSGSSNFFIFEKVDENWLIIDTDFHQKLSSEYVLKVVGKIFSIIGGIFLAILVIGVLAYIQMRKKRKEVPAETPVISIHAEIPKLEYQGVGIRFAATLIDGIVVSFILAIFIPFLLIFAIMFQLPENIEWLFSAILILIMIFFPLAYYSILEGTKGATLGKMICGIRVVHEDGTPCDIPSAIIRNLLRLVDGLFGYLVGAIIIWNSDKKQRLGDIVAKTIVINKDKTD